MSNLVFGYTSVTVGALYLVLTAQVLRELRQAGGPLAFGFIGAFTTCALHHLFHAHHLLGSDVAADLPEGLAMMASIVPASVYVRFRFNALVGRPADHEIDSFSTPALNAMVVSVAVSGGFLVWVAMRSVGRTEPLDGWAFWPGIIMFAAYLAVAWLLALTQVQRHRTEGVVSSSAVTFTAVFFTCSLSHYAYALGRTEADWHMAAADTLGVFGALGFVTIVVRLRRTHHRRYASLVGGARIRETKIVPPWVTASN